MATNQRTQRKIAVNRKKNAKMSMENHFASEWHFFTLMIAAICFWPNTLPNYLSTLYIWRNFFYFILLSAFSHFISGLLLFFFLYLASFNLSDMLNVSSGSGNCRNICHKYSNEGKMKMHSWGISPDH